MKGVVPLAFAIQQSAECPLRVLVVSKRLPAVAKRHDGAVLRELCVGVG